jgi:CAAX protease family protein
MSLVRRHPTIAFFVLVYTLAWGFESPLDFPQDNVSETQGFVLVLLASNVPSVVGIVLTAILLVRGALRKLLGRLPIWRVNPFWYLGVILGPVALAGSAAAFDTLLGGPTLRLGMPLLGVAFLLAFSIIPGSALGEEIGWRGYALPRQQVRGSALGASLIIGPIWALWHLPLWLTGEPGRTLTLYAAFVVSTIALSVILTWVYNGTSGSLLLVVLLHATFNLPITLVVQLLGSQATVPILLYFGLEVAAAMVVIVVAGPKHISRKHTKQEEPSEILPKASAYAAQLQAR